MTDTKLPHDVIRTLVSDPAFKTCLDACFEEPEFISNFCRLYEIDLPRQPKSPVEWMVDEATGYRKDTFDKFFTAFIPFVHRVVYLPMKLQFERDSRQQSGSKKGGF